MSRLRRLTLSAPVFIVGYLAYLGSAGQTAANASSTLPSLLFGQWTGQVYQQDSGERYPVTMTIDALIPGQLAGSIQYSSLGCSGSLTFLQQTMASFTFREKITEIDKCVDGGLISVSFPSADVLKWEWFYPEGALNVFGLLVRSGATPGDNLIYSNVFTNTVGPEWSRSTVDTTPTGRKFLGQFGNDTVTLALTDLAPHSQVRLAFDLYVIHSWDGNDTSYGYDREGNPGPRGPDVWGVSVLQSPQLLHTTFSNQSGIEKDQAYPDPYPGGDHPGETGTTEVNTLGYEDYFGDSVYHMEFSFSHGDSDLAVTFSATGLQVALSDESWGLANVAVYLGATTSPPELIDTDTDGVPDTQDDCPLSWNPEQTQAACSHSPFLASVTGGLGEAVSVFHGDSPCAQNHQKYGDIFALGPDEQITVAEAERSCQQQGFHFLNQAIFDALTTLANAIGSGAIGVEDIVKDLLEGLFVLKTTPPPAPMAAQGNLLTAAIVGGLTITDVSIVAAWSKDMPVPQPNQYQSVTLIHEILSVTVSEALDGILQAGDKFANATADQALMITVLDVTRADTTQLSLSLDGLVGNGVFATPTPAPNPTYTVLATATPSPHTAPSSSPVPTSSPSLSPPVDYIFVQTAMGNAYCTSDEATNLGFASAVLNWASLANSDPAVLGAQFRTIYVPPGLSDTDYGSLAQLSAVNGVIERFVLLGGVAVINVAPNSGMPPDSGSWPLLAPDGIGFQASAGDNEELIGDNLQPYFSGAGYGGVSLNAADFLGWNSTDSGYLTNVSANARVLLNGPLGSGFPSMVEYVYGAGRVIVSTLMFCNPASPRSIGNALDNLLKYGRFYQGGALTPASTVTPTQTFTPTRTLSLTAAPSSTPTSHEITDPTSTATRTSAPLPTLTKVVEATVTATHTQKLNTPTARPEACVGDCSGSGTVSISDLLLGVDIALGILPVSACPAFETTDGDVTIAQIIKGVNNALSDCGR